MSLHVTCAAVLAKTFVMLLRLTNPGLIAAGCMSGAVVPGSLSERDGLVCLLHRGGFISFGEIRCTAVS